VLAADALAVFLRALGMPAQDLPADPDERAAQYRSLLAGRRILVVLDNASDVTQVRPLLPGSPTCFTLVTSRDSLAGLVARDGAQRLEVTLLPPADAVGLLRKLIGERVTADPSAAATMARQCCGLPLALRIAAEIASARPGIPLAGLSAELADLGQRLDQLEVPGDERTAVRAVFSWSLRHLDPDGARAFRLAGLHPGRDLDQYTMAALAGVPLAAARRLLDQLARAYLLQPTGLGRYGQHDLLRGYARELAGQHESDLDRQAALTRLFDYYLAATAAASGMLFPSQRHRLPRLPEPGPLPPLDDAATARAWLDEHRPGLVLVAGYLAEHDWPSHVTRLAVILYSYLIRGGYYTEAIAINGHALRAAGRHGDQSGAAAARQGLGAAALQQGRFAEATDQLRQAAVLYHGQGDQLGEAYALSNLGLIDLQLGHEAQGADHYHQALELARQGGDRNCEGRVLGKLGYIARQHGRYGAATELYQQAVTLAQQVEDPHGEAEALSGLGPVELKQGHEQLAAGYQRKALALYREIGDRNGTAMALVRLGNAEMRGDRCDQADAVLQQALGLYRELGDRYGVAEALALLGLNAIRQQRHAAAAGLLRQAVTLFRETGDRSGEAQALNGLGAVFLAYGQPGRACRQHSAALTLAGQAGDQDREAQAYEGLARAYQAAGNAEEARRSWQEALWRYAELGLPEADQIRAQLVSAGTPSPA
jgi:tetratricopeptide (TPR) repeat protein